MEHDQMLDIRGMCCAAPMIRLTKEFRGFRSGEVVLVMADKSSMRNDIPVWCTMTKNRLMKTDDVRGLLRFWIEKR